jgi:MFS family permease
MAHSKKNVWQIYVLALVFPLSLMIIGFVLGGVLLLNVNSLILGVLGLFLGTIISYISYYRKTFTVVMFWFPVPMALMLSFYWISKPFFVHYVSVVIAVLGLLVGLLINKSIIQPHMFFRIRKIYLVILYVFYSILLLGLFKGVPVVNLLLGVLAGNYFSIRLISNKRTKYKIYKNIRQGALFSAVVFFILSAYSFLMAVIDIENLLYLFNSYLKVKVGYLGFETTIAFFIVVLTVLQYFVTYYSSKYMFKYRMRKRPSSHYLNL